MRADAGRDYAGCNGSGKSWIIKRLCGQKKADYKKSVQAEEGLNYRKAGGQSVETSKEPAGAGGMLENLERLIDEGRINPQNRIFFFGANKSSIEMNSFLQNRGFAPEAFIDNSRKKQGTLVEGLPVYAPEEALKAGDGSIRVLIASEYHAEMCRQLDGLGYKKDEQAFVVYMVNDFYNFYDTGRGGFEKHAEEARRGMRVYERLAESGEPEFLFLCPYPGTGDIFLIGGYLEKYMERHGIGRAVATVTAESGKKILELYGTRGIRIEVLSRDESNDLAVFLRIMGGQVPGIILNDNFQRVMHRRLRGYKGIDFHTMFKYAVFGMEEGDRIKLPYSRPASRQDRQKAVDFLRENGLAYGKTAILSPYANTISNLPMAVWEKIAAALKNKGYAVCTNSASEREPAIKGTLPLFIPFSMAVPVLEAGGLFIAMRSGLCDIAAGAKCRKIILYPKGCIFGACTTYEYFSLNAMGLCSDAVEIEFDAGEYGSIMEIVDKNT